MSGSDRAAILDHARRSFEERDWPLARDLFKKAEALGPLDAADVSALGDCHWWLGETDEAIAALETAYRKFLTEDEKKRAAFNALGLAITLFNRGEEQLGMGWMGRAHRLLEGEPESVEHGYLAYIGLEGALGSREYQRLLEETEEVARIGQRFGDPNLVALASMFEGRALIGLGRIAEGLVRLDEAALSVLEGGLHPDWAGSIYCHLMAAYYELLDLRRAADWVEATQTWLDTLPEAVLFTGICRIHRSQILTLRGAWDDAERQARRVAEELKRVHVVGAAEGWYQLGELARLRGDLTAAEDAYMRANELGRDPQPGLSLLRLALGKQEVATASIRSALIAAGDDPLRRAPLLVAQIDIALAASDLEAAEAACREIEELATTYGSSGLVAHARQVRGALCVAGGNPEDALSTLRDACQRWRELGVELHAAAVCALLADAYRAIGDEDSAERELDNARRSFERLGAAPQITRLAKSPRQAGSGLSPRELEVLRLVAEGRSNRDVAEALTLSEKTIARHLSNIYNKLDVASRTEAAAYAFTHGIVGADG